MAFSSEFLILNFINFLIAVGCTLVLTIYFINKLTQNLMLDLPNNRSSHTVPTPRGGGLAVLITWVFCIIFSLFFVNLPINLLWLVPAIIILAIISYLDDRKNIAWGARITIQAIAVFFGLQSLPDTLITNNFLPKWLELFGIFMFWLWFINLTNFIDGLDGITATNGIMLGFSTLILSVLSQMPSYYFVFAVIFMGSMIGFIRYNWHPAKIFLGDVGSIPIGFISGYFIVSLALNHLVFAAILIPLIPFLDATYTLIKRAYERKKITDAHNEHAYQKAFQNGQSQPKICIKIAFFSLLLLLLSILTVIYNNLILNIALTVFGLLSVSYLINHFRRTRMGYD